MFELQEVLRFSVFLKGNAQYVSGQMAYFDRDDCGDTAIEYVFKGAYDELQKELSNANAQIIDYENVLIEITKGNFGTRGNVLAQQVINKWRAK